MIVYGNMGKCGNDIKHHTFSSNLFSNLLGIALRFSFELNMTAKPTLRTQHIEVY